MALGPARARWRIRDVQTLLRVDGAGDGDSTKGQAMMNADQKRAHRERMKQRAAVYRAAGLCLNCGRERDTEAVHCVKCRGSKARWQRQQIELRQVARTTPRLPFYPVVKQSIQRWPPPVLGSLAYVMAHTP